MVYRIFVEKKPAFDQEAEVLRRELTDFLGVASLTGLRVLNRYDAEGISKDLFDQAVFRFRHLTVAPFPDKHNKVLQETDLLHIQLFTLNAERIHGDGVLFRIANIFASHIFAEPFIGVPCIDHNNVCILFPKLSDYTVHVETLAATAWAKAEKI